MSRKKKGSHAYQQLSIPVEEQQGKAAHNKNKSHIQSPRPAKSRRAKVAGRRDTRTKRLVELVRSQMFHRL